MEGAPVSPASMRNVSPTPSMITVAAGASSSAIACLLSSRAAASGLTAAATAASARRNRSSSSTVRPLRSRFARAAAARSATAKASATTRTAATAGTSAHAAPMTATVTTAHRDASGHRSGNLARSMRQIVTSGSKAVHSPGGTTRLARTGWSGQLGEGDLDAVAPRGDVARTFHLPRPARGADQRGALVDPGDDEPLRRELERAVLLLLRPGVVVGDHRHALEQPEPEREGATPRVDHGIAQHHRARRRSGQGHAAVPPLEDGVPQRRVL